MAKEYKVNIEHILLSYYIKYNKLTELTQKTLYKTDTDFIEIYVDLYDMLKPLYSTNVFANNKYTIVSSIINLAAHLRSYFWSSYRVSTRIYLVYANETSTNHKQFYYNFGDNNLESMNNFEKINEFISSQLEMAKILCAYIYDVYLIRKTTDFSMFTYDSIIKNNIPSVILTKSKYAFQIPSLLKNVFIFRPKKYNGDDISYYIDKYNVLQNFYKKSLNKQDTITKINELNPEILSLLITLTGLPQKKLLTLYNAPTAINKLHDAVINYKIINGYNSDLDYIYKVLGIPNSKIDLVNFKYRFNAVDLQYQHSIYTYMPEYNDMSWNINLNDANTIKEINNKYFIDNPLYLNQL